MAYEPWSLPPLPDSPVVPLYAIQSNTDHALPTRRGSPARQHNTTAACDSERASVGCGHKAAAASPNKRSQTVEAEYRAQTRFPSSPRKPISPTKVPLPPSPERTYPSPQRTNLSPPKPLLSSAAESSFMLPANLSESMIGETSMPTMLMDESLDFGVNSLLGARGLPRREDLGYRQTLDKVVEGSTTPTRIISHMSATPARTKPTRLNSAKKPPATMQRTATAQTSPAKTPLTSRPTPRTYPASASHRAVSRCINSGDISTLLPVSPARTAHLTRDEHQLLRESLPLSEGPSFFLPPPPSSTRRSPRKPNKADMTLDIHDLMAKMTKPKRPSGTEESFEDLLNGPDLDFDQTLNGNEPFLPAGLRPPPKHAVIPIKHTPARVRNAMQVEAATRSPSKMDETAPRFSSKPHTFSSPRRATDSPNRTSSTRATPAASRLAPTMRTPTAAVSPRRPAPATTGRRVSLSTGALPLPSSASVPKLSSFATARTGHARSGSTTIASAMAHVPSTSGLTRGGSSTITPAAATKAGYAPTSRPGSSRPLAGSGQDSNASPVKSASTTAPARSAVPRPSHARTGSTTSLTAPSSRTAPSTATSRTAGVSTAISARPASFRPTSQAPPPKSSLPPYANRTSQATLPRPGAGPSARSALVRPTSSITAASRAFGTDGAGTTNRLSARPGGSTMPSSRAEPAQGKMSMVPPASPAKRETAASLKSRAASTPAEKVTRTIARPTAIKSSIPPPGPSRTATQATSTIPRAPTSRLPTTTTGSSRLPSAANRNSANILALRAKIDALSAKQGATRR